MSNDVPKMVECRPLSERMKHLLPVAYLPEQKARELADLGDVEIVGEEASKTETPTPIQVDIGYLKRDRFSKYRQLTRVAWVQDMSRMGGAELSNCVVVNAGEQCGFDIIGVTPARFSEDILYTCDLIVLNNCMEFQPEQFHRLRYHLHERAIPFVKYEHDYREFKRTNVSQPFFTRSMLNVFLSPKHMERHAKIFGEEIVERSAVLPLAIDTNLFTSGIGVDREEDLVLVPNYKKCGKRIDEYMLAHKEYRYAVIGQVPQLPGTVEHLPKVPNDQMPKYYSRCAKMLHLPVDYWAGERIYFEAALCGCTPVVDTEHVGHASWLLDVSDTASLKATLDRAPYTFWREVDACLSKL